MEGLGARSINPGGEPGTSGNAGEVRESDEAQADGLYDSEEDGREFSLFGSDSNDESDPDVVFNEGVDSPSRFDRCGRSGALRSELDWARFGAAEAGLGEEVLNVNEQSAVVASSSFRFFSGLHQRGGVTPEQLAKVTSALFAPSSAGASSSGQVPAPNRPLDSEQQRDGQTLSDCVMTYGELQGMTRRCAMRVLPCHSMRCLPMRCQQLAVSIV